MDTEEVLCNTRSAIYDEPTCKLVGELEKRMGVNVHTVEPYQQFELRVTGPAIILVVED